MPSSTLLPTPEPAKIPSRWPRPHVSMPSMHRTPRAQRQYRSAAARVADDRRRSAAGIDPRSIGCGRPSMHRPRASITRPNSAGPIFSVRAVRISRTALPRRTPSRSLSGITSVRSSRKPITSASTSPPDCRRNADDRPHRRRHAGDRDGQPRRLHDAAGDAGQHRVCKLSSKRSSKHCVRFRRVLIRCSLDRPVIVLA